MNDNFLIPGFPGSLVRGGRTFLSRIEALGNDRSTPWADRWSLRTLRELGMLYTT